jgi:hypothetical protein
MSKVTAYLGNSGGSAPSLVLSTYLSMELCVEQFHLYLENYTVRFHANKSYSLKQYKTLYTSSSLPQPLFTIFLYISYLFHILWCWLYSLLSYAPLLSPLVFDYSKLAKAGGLFAHSMVQHMEFPADKFHSKHLDDGISSSSRPLFNPSKFHIGITKLHFEPLLALKRTIKQVQYSRTWRQALFHLFIFPLRIFCSRVIVTPYSRDDLSAAIESSASIPGFTCSILPWKWPRFRGEIYLDGGITLLLSKVCITPQQANSLSYHSIHDSIVYIFPQMFSFRFPSFFHYFLFGSKSHYFRMFQRGYADAKKFHEIFERAFGMEGQVKDYGNIHYNQKQQEEEKEQGINSFTDKEEKEKSIVKSSSYSLLESLEQVETVAEMEMLGVSRFEAMEELKQEENQNQSNNQSSNASRRSSVSSKRSHSKTSSSNSTRSNSLDLTIEGAAVEDLIENIQTIQSVGETHLQSIEF